MSLKNGALAPGKYSNEHKIEFNENTIITGDSAPDWKGDPNNSNPEQTLAASFKQLSHDDVFSFGCENEMACDKLQRYCNCKTW